MEPPNHRVDVYYRFPLAASIIATILFCACGVALIAQPELLKPKNSPGEWFDAVYPIVLLGFAFLVGPIAVWKYSTRVVLQQRLVFVTRLFGAVKKIYRVTEVADVSYRERKQYQRRMKVRFSDGAEVVLDGFAINLDRLRQALIR